MKEGVPEWAQANKGGGNCARWRSESAVTIKNNHNYPVCSADAAQPPLVSLAIATRHSWQITCGSFTRSHKEGDTDVAIIPLWLCVGRKNPIKNTCGNGNEFSILDLNSMGIEFGVFKSPSKPGARFVSLFQYLASHRNQRTIRIDFYSFNWFVMWCVKKSIK